MSWIYYALLAIVVVGVSDILRKFTSGFQDPFYANLLFQIGSFSAAVVSYILFSRHTENNPRLLLFALAGGALISLFTLISFKTLSIGPGVSTVIPVLRIGGILLVVLLGIVFLKEQFTVSKTIGLMLSFIGVYLLFSK